MPKNCGHQRARALAIPERRKRDEEADGETADNDRKKDARAPDGRARGSRELREVKWEPPRKSGSLRGPEKVSVRVRKVAH